MSAEIIDLKAKRPPGNGAREALIDLLNDLPCEVRRTRAEHFLMELWARGFKVVPLEGNE
jgi:hypothetical protein